MPHHILHLLDPSTPRNAAETLAHLLRARTDSAHSIAILGHRSTATLLAAEGLCTTGIHWLPSLGYADPTGWRALRRLATRLRPSRLHAWGLPAALASARACPDIDRLISLADMPRPRPPALYRWINKPDPARITWTTPSPLITAHLTRHGIAPDRILTIRPGIESPNPNINTSLLKTELRDALGLLPEDGPILLVGGDGTAGGSGGGWARHDYALWAAAILQQIFPRVRAVIRDDLRHRQNPGLERLLNDLPDGDVPVVAPADWSWQTLLSLADVLVISADGPVSMIAALHAMAAGVPVVGMPVPAVTEVITHDHNGLLARELKPRAIAARVEELMADPAVRTRLTTTAKNIIAKEYAVPDMLAAFRGAYEGLTIAAWAV